MARTKKMAFGGMGSKIATTAKALPKVAPAIYKQIVGGSNTAKLNDSFNPANAANAANIANAANAARQNAMATNPAPRKPLTQANPMGMGMSQDTSALNKIGQAKAQAKPMGGGMSDAAARFAMNSTNSGTFQSGAGPKPDFGAAVKQMGLGTATNVKSGGSVGSASKRADGIAQRGKTRA